MFRRFLLTSIALLCLPSAAHAIHRVELDRTFQTDGVVLYNAGNVDVRVIAHLPERDGGSVAVLAMSGGACPADRECVGLARYDERGRVRSGGAPAVTATEFSMIAAAAIDSQDRVVVVGSKLVAQNDYDFRVVRLRSNGSLDPSFNGSGVQQIALDNGGEHGDYAHAVAIDAQDRIVIAGQTEQHAPMDLDFGVFRLRADGTPDPTFGNNGEVIVAFDLQAQNPTDVARAVAVGADGRIVVAGTVRDFAAGVLRLGIARLEDDGSYDTTWCNPDCLYNDAPHLGNGRRIIYIGDAGDARTHELHDVAVGDGGEVIYVGGSRFGGVFKGFVQRLAYDGEYNYETELDAADPDPGSATTAGAINLVDPGNPASDMIVTGITGPGGARTFFAQRLAYELSPVADWGGSDPAGSLIHFNGTGGFFDPGDNFTGISRLDRRGRLLVAGAIEYPDPAGPKAGVAARITSSEQIFFDGYEP